MQARCLERLPKRKEMVPPHLLPIVAHLTASFHLLIMFALIQISLLITRNHPVLIDDTENFFNYHGGTY